MITKKIFLFAASIINLVILIFCLSVNSIAPAMTNTPLCDILSADVLAKATEKMPHGHLMEPTEIAEWVRFLASPAGDISSGNIIILNQGRDVH